MGDLKMINEVYTITEASKLWGIGQATVKHACTGQHGKPPRFIVGVECRKSGGIWLVMKAGMERLWGKLEGED